MLLNQIMLIELIRQFKFASVLALHGLYVFYFYYQNIMHKTKKATEMNHGIGVS